MKKLLATAAAVAFAGAPAFGSDVLGSWETTVDTPDAVYEATVTITEADGGYAIEWTDTGAAAMDLPSEFSNVEIGDNSFSFLRSIDFQGTAFEVTYSGTVEGDTLTGTAASAMGEAPMTGSRVVGASAAED
ncbi:MAG: hypothetical protein PVI23_14575 [Maricaulaceae bacterium]